MLALERKNQILAELLSKGNVVVADLSERYRVTKETIRRDLEKLAQEGYAHTTYGGAVRSDGTQTDLPYLVRRQTQVAGKRSIAACLAARIEDGQTLALDASSSALFIARALLSRKHLTVLTNSVELLTELAGKTDWNILSTGGTLKENGLALVGHTAERMVEAFHFNWAILSCKGLDTEMGFSDSNEADAEMKRAFLRAADRVVFAVDHSKFDQRSFVQVMPLTGANLVVTDVAPDSAWLDRFQAANVELLIAEGDESC